MPFDKHGRRTDWKHTIKIKHLFTEEEDPDSVEESMKNIADVLEKESKLKTFQYLDRCRKIDDLRTANAFLSKLYDFCDENAIWVE
jgi:hypothetical protein